MSVRKAALHLGIRRKWLISKQRSPQSKVHLQDFVPWMPMKPLAGWHLVDFTRLIQGTSREKPQKLKGRDAEGSSSDTPRNVAVTLRSFAVVCASASGLFWQERRMYGCDLARDKRRIANGYG